MLIFNRDVYTCFGSKRCHVSKIPLTFVLQAPLLLRRQSPRFRASNMEQRFYMREILSCIAGFRLCNHSVKHLDMVFIIVMQQKRWKHHSSLSVTSCVPTRATCSAIYRVAKWFCGESICLVPANFSVHQGTHITSNFYETDSISFVGRPFALTAAKEHSLRLRAWGFTFVRRLVPWETVEQKGPGEYDEECLDYLLAIVREACTHGISCIIDPHQDVWSHWSGGDGARLCSIVLDSTSRLCTQVGRFLHTQRLVTTRFFRV